MADKRLNLPTAAAQILIKYLLDDQPCESVMYCEHEHRATLLDGYASAPFNASNADVVATRVKAWLTDHWADTSHTKAEATEVEVIWNTGVGTGPLGGKVYQDSDYPIVGTQTEAALPNNATIAVKWSTGLIGRAFHGRTYHVGLTTNQVSVDHPNVLTDEARSGLIAAYDALRVGMAAAEFVTLDIDDPVNDRFPLQVVSFVDAGSPRVPAVTTVVTSAALTDSFLDSMRRRLPAHNRHGRRG